MLRRLLLVLLAPLVLLALGLLGAVRPPAIRTHRIALEGWPAGAPPLRLVLLSDTHVAGPDMPPERLAGIVATVNALRPDCVLLGGDYVSEKRFATRHYGYGAAVAPFAALRPRLKTIGVAGNHDQGIGGRGGPRMLAALRRVGVATLANTATRCGVLTIAGADDYPSGKLDMAATLAAADALPGPRLLLAHSPDVLMWRQAAAFPLVLAGHTHCGQIALPFVGAIFTATRVGRRYACGLVRDSRRVTIVGAGLGTSALPLRYFTRPEILLVEVGGPR